MPQLPDKARLIGVTLAVLFFLPCSRGEDLPAFEDDDDPGGALLEATWQTRQDVRSLNLKIPPPRGQIVDRHGLPLAVNHICNYLAVQLPGKGGLSDPEVLAFAKERVDRANKALGTKVVIDETKLLGHYQNRRWLPFPFSAPLKDKELRTMASKLDQGLILFPTYSRSYPHGKTAGHIIGYSGRKAAMETSAPVSGEPIFPFSEGREGLEASFDEYLQGQPGDMHRLYDDRGELVVEEMNKRPMPGLNVVTTLDLGMQKLAESTLANYCRRGALVVLDVYTGDVLAMASRPGYDPNLFLPYISEDDFAALRNDPAKPLFPRAYAGAYPPASTFKVVTALAGLESGVIDGDTRIDSPGSMRIHGRVFKNWHSGHEGKIDVERALARSCNTWFYRVGMDTGGENFSSMGRRLGFGQSSGLPLRGEVAGTLPTEEWMQETFGYGFADGYLANAAIGQGDVLTTPLQVAQMMAGVANRHSLPQLRLVSQIQDVDGRVLKAFPVRAKNALNISNEHLQFVTDGLVNVVHAGHGTGKGAVNGHYTVAGKTGTGQWGQPSKKQYVAWFAGFVPADNPRYAFAALYEGRPGEYLSGGKKAAPIVASYFKAVFDGRARAANATELARYGGTVPPDDILTQLEAEKAMLAAVDDPEEIVDDGQRLSLEVPPPRGFIAAPAPRPARQEPPRKDRTVLSRLFGKKKR